jgi:alginate O-acetyltransferase complex protein AlgI
MTVLSASRIFAEIYTSWLQVTFVDRVFIFAFVPATMSLVWLATKTRPLWLAPLTLAICSLIFYASWGPWPLTILIASMSLNYAGRTIMTRLTSPVGSKRVVALSVIVVGNLSALATFKYVDLFAGTAAHLMGQAYQPSTLLVPLGISFYTFQEIVLAVDAYRGTPRVGFLKYVLFICFFPHLVAGPLVHHREMVPQFSRIEIRWHDVTIGLSLFAIGLTKKICVADPLSPIVHSVFDTNVAALQIGWAWAGSLAYAFQIYFDFSGYSDMALGLGRLFGIKLPINFYSPYKAQNIAEFWRRWHMTLSRFLREYIYIPLGGNKHGLARRNVNLMIVMLAGGLWHGSNWTFVVWGGLHGLFLVIHQLWRKMTSVRFPNGLAVSLTFLCVTFAWVPFRADSISRTLGIWSAMLGCRGVEKTGGLVGLVGAARVMIDTVGSSLPPAIALAGTLVWLFILVWICCVAPNSAEMLQLEHPWPGGKHFPSPKPSRVVMWRPTFAWGGAIGLMFGLAMFLSRQLPQEFLYWKF